MCVCVSVFVVFVCLFLCLFVCLFVCFLSVPFLLFRGWFKGKPSGQRRILRPPWFDPHLLEAIQRVQAAVSWVPSGVPEVQKEKWGQAFGSSCRAYSQADLGGCWSLFRGLGYP